MKVFSSREPLDALVGEAGVESQFANRFSKFEFMKPGKLLERALFGEVGKDVYARSVRTKFAEILNDQVEIYRAMGRDTATLTADTMLGQLHDEHGLGNFHDDLDEHAGELAVEIAEFFRDAKAGWGETRGSNLGRLARDCRDRIVMVYRDRDAKEPVYMITKASTLIKEYIKLMYSDSEKVKVGVKSSEIAEMMDAGDYHAVKNFYVIKDGDRHTQRGVFIELKHVSNDEKNVSAVEREWHGDFSDLTVEASR